MRSKSSRCLPATSKQDRHELVPLKYEKDFCFVSSQVLCTIGSNSSAHLDAICGDPQTSPHRSPRTSRYPTPSSLKASQSRSNHFVLVLSSVGASTTTSTNTPMALYTAVPRAPDEESTCCKAGHNFSISLMAPSAPVNGSVRATFRISETASLIRWQANLDPFHP